MLKWLLSLDAIMAAVFLIDIIFGFCRPYNDMEGESIEDPIKMATNYARRSFRKDLLTSVPWPLIIYAIGGATTLHWRWLYLISIFMRPSKVMNSFRGLERLAAPATNKFVQFFFSRNDFRAHARIMSKCAYAKHFVYILILLVVAAHVLACMWIYTALYITHGPSYAAQNNNWMIEGNVINSKISSIYTAAIYWAMTTLTTVGYGDLSPTSTGERLLATFALVIGIAINALFIGRMSVLLLEFTETSTQQRRHRQLVEKVCGQYNFPSQLRRRIDRLTSMRFSGVYSTTALDVDAFLCNMSPTLRQECLYFMHRRIFDEVPVLRFNSLSFQRSVAIHLRSALFVDRDYIAVFGTPCDSISFLLSGVVRVLNQDGKITHLLEAGSFFGEQGILSTWSRIKSQHINTGGNPDHIRVPFGLNLCAEKFNFSVRVNASFCEVYYLDYHHLLKIFQQFPSFVDSIRVAGRLRTATANASARISKSSSQAAQKQEAYQQQALASAQGLLPRRQGTGSGGIIARGNQVAPVSLQKAPTQESLFARPRTPPSSLQHNHGENKKPLKSTTAPDRAQTPPWDQKYWGKVTANPKFIQKYMSLSERSRSIQGALYKPQVVDMSDKVLPWSIQRIVRHMTQHVHEYWSQRRFNSGWKWGFAYSEVKKTHPQLKPYVELTHKTRCQRQNAVIYVLKMLQSQLGINIDNSEMDSTKLQWQFGDAVKSLSEKRNSFAHKKHTKDAETDATNSSEFHEEDVCKTTEDADVSEKVGDDDLGDDILCVAQKAYDTHMAALDQIKGLWLVIEKKKNF